MSIVAPESLNHEGLIIRIEKSIPNELNELKCICTEIQDEATHQFLLEWAAKSGATPLVDYLLHQSRANPSANSSLTLNLALLNEHSEVVELLLKDERLDPSFNNNQLLQEAVEQKRGGVVFSLLKHPKIISSVNRQYMIGIAMKNNDPQMISILCEDKKFDPSVNDQHLLRWACSKDHLTLAEKLIMDPRANRSIYDFRILLNKSKSDDLNRFDFNKLIKSCFEIRDETVLNELLAFSISLNENTIVEKLLHNDRVDPKAINHRSFRIAVSRENVGAVQLLLNDGRIDPNVGLRIALEKSNHTIMALLLEDPRVDPSIDKKDFLIHAVERKKMQMLSMLLKHPKLSSPVDRYYAIRLAVHIKDVDMIHLITESGTVDFSTNDYELIIWAASNNYGTLVQAFMKDMGADFDKIFIKLFSALKKNNNKNVMDVLFSYFGEAFYSRRELFSMQDMEKIFSKAVFCSYCPFVEMLLAHPEIKVHLTKDRYLFSQKFHWACDNGNIDLITLLLKEESLIAIFNVFEIEVYLKNLTVFKLLIESGKIDFSLENNIAIIKASELGYDEVVDLLLKSHNPNINPAVKANLPLRLACSRGHDQVVKRLLEDSRVNPRDKNSDALKNSALYGQFKVVKLLLESSKMKVGWNNNALTQAAMGGHPDVVALFLEDGRIEPTVRDNEALQAGVSKGNIDVVRLLLNDPRVENTQNLHMSLAIKLDHEPVVSLIREHKNTRLLSYFSLIKELSKNTMERKETLQGMPWPNRLEITKAKRETTPDPKVLYAGGILFDCRLPRDVSSAILTHAFPNFLEPSRTKNPFDQFYPFYLRFFQILEDKSTSHVEDVTNQQLEDAMDIDDTISTVVPTSLKRKLENESADEDSEGDAISSKKSRYYR